MRNENRGEHDADLGFAFLRRLLVGTQLVRVEVGAVAVERVREAHARAHHGPVDVDGLDVGVEHQPNDLVEHRELAVGRVPEDASRSEPTAT
jgi:hypothetical protein